MPDIRTTPLLDDFDRPVEDPIEFPWGQAATAIWGEMAILTPGSIGPSGTGDKQAYYIPQSFDGEIELWAIASAAPDLTEAYRQALLQNAGSGSVNGYAIRIVNAASAFAWTLSRITGNGFTELYNDNNEPIGGLDLVMMRLTATNVEMWYSHDNGANWSLAITVADSTYRTGLHICLGCSSDDATGPGWNAVGGGEILEWIPQFYRRPTD